MTTADPDFAGNAVRDARRVSRLPWLGMVAAAAAAALFFGWSWQRLLPADTALQERLAAEERHRQSLEEKHKHARQALEHFRESTKEQRDQDQRKHEQQVQYLQAELRTVNETLATKQQEAVHTLQENARLLGDLSRAQGDLHPRDEVASVVRHDGLQQERLVAGNEQQIGDRAGAAAGDREHGPAARALHAGE